jgi:hypothetical protein
MRRTALLALSALAAGAALAGPAAADEAEAEAPAVKRGDAIVAPSL